MRKSQAGFLESDGYLEVLVLSEYFLSVPLCSAQVEELATSACGAQGQWGTHPSAFPEGSLVSLAGGS